MAYKHVIRANTKNLLDYNKFNPIWKTNGIISDSGYLSKPASTFNTSLFYTVSGYSATLPDLSNLLQLKGTYTFSISSISIGDIYIMQYNADGTMNKQIGFLTNNKKVETLTFDELTYVDIKIQREIAVIVTGLMVQEGSTATPYTPYNYLSSNKRMIKVSDVCQVFNKEEFIPTTTRGGITFTNNGDGTFTLNGTATANVFIELFKSGTDITGFNINHKYLICGNLSDTIQIFETLSGNGARHYEDSIFTCVKSKGYLDLRIIVGTTATNYVFRPQLFDLTEMFGAGHEPATVAEFRQRFPNELYPYFPQCWLTSYKSAVVCKTKNLFDVNNAAPYTNTNDTPPSNKISLKDGIYTTTYNNYNVGSGLRIKDGWTLPAGTYTVSAVIVDLGGNIHNLVIGLRYKIADGTWKYNVNVPLSFSVGSRIIAKCTIPENTEMRLYLTFQINDGTEGFVSYKGIQVEQGSTATSYVPYQHL